MKEWQYYIILRDKELTGSDCLFFVREGNDGDGLWSEDIDRAKLWNHDHQGDALQLSYQLQRRWGMHQSDTMELHVERRKGDFSHTNYDYAMRIVR